MDRPYISVIRSIFLQLHGKSVLYLTELQQMLVLPMRITGAKMVLHDERSAFPVDGAGDGFRWIGYRHTGINEVHAAVERRLRARYAIIAKQRAEAYKRVAEAKATAKYMDEKAAHYEAILAGLAPDDTNPRNWTAENRPQHEHK